MSETGRTTTTGKLAKAISALPRLGFVNKDMVRSWVELGLIKADRNPLKESGWYNIHVDAVPAFLRETLKLDQEQIEIVLLSLSVSEQTQLIA